MTETGPKSHASLGASSSDRWINCPGSLAISEGLEDTTSIHAELGTTAHAVCELGLLMDREAADFIGEPHEGHEVDEEMAEAVQVYLDTVRPVAKGPHRQLWVERAFDLNAINPDEDMWGTSDAIVLDRDARKLTVFDFKYGSGVVVEAKDNPQLRYYALGAVLSIEAEVGGGLIDEIEMVIVQPRAQHEEGNVRRDTMTYADLVAWAGELMAAAERTRDPNAPRVPGRWCRFCKAKAICPEKLDQARSIAMTEFAPATPAPPAPASLPIEVLSDVLDHLDILEDWIRDCRAHAKSMLERGEEVPGFKLVAKRATRKWADEEAARRSLEREGYVPEEYLESKLLSPAKLEKIIGKQHPVLAQFVIKQSSGFNLAPASDKREAVSLGAQHEFDALPAPAKGSTP